ILRAQKSPRRRREGGRPRPAGARRCRIDARRGPRRTHHVRDRRQPRQVRRRRRRRVARGAEDQFQAAARRAARHGEVAVIRQYLNSLPIGSKLVAMIMLTSGLVLALASAGYVFWDYYQLRSDLENDVQSQSRLALGNAEAALRFGDTRVAGEILSTL